eukprot:CAMPEP_0170491022 /NCGR_PEP_ID=MMETSP0208-20121228/10247_1 /TAXON_ID=197538 /ORGANISM="Strombidium inclinatum, Strain S3" /LENGTH=88 /DNA_ID=CAMNT_0010766525 /DNA_START=16 /DNA_END=282 /DNA_ORIENTATION=+
MGGVAGPVTTTTTDTNTNFYNTNRQTVLNNKNGANTVVFGNPQTTNVVNQPAAHPAATKKATHALVLLNLNSNEPKLFPTGPISDLYF